jgi:hypothetical protein
VTHASTNHAGRISFISAATGAVCYAQCLNWTESQRRLQKLKDKLVDEHVRPVTSSATVIMEPSRTEISIASIHRDPRSEAAAKLRPVMVAR